MKTRLLIIILTGLFVSGCNEPRHIVHGNAEMVVYSIKKMEEGKDKNGIYEYWITDETSNWTLRTDKVFSINDKIEINTVNN